jgi:hypothetical protein
MSFQVLPKKGLSRAQVEAEAQAAFASGFPPLKSGQFISHTLRFGGAYGAVAITAGTLYAVPFAVPFAVTVDQVAIDVTVASTTGTAVRVGVGVFDTDTAWAITLEDDIAAIVTDTTGAKTNAYAKTFEPGILYAALVIPQAAVTIRTHSGSQELFGSNTATDTVARLGLTKSGHGYGALPATVTMTGTSAAPPVVRFRVA